MCPLLASLVNDAIPKCLNATSFKFLNQMYLGYNLYIIKGNYFKGTGQWVLTNIPCNYYDKVKNISVTS